MLRNFSWLPLLLVTAQLNAEQIVLDKNYFEHIHFKRIRPNTVTFNNDTIHFEVTKSASFLLLAFDDVKSIHKVSFQWSANGTLNKNSIDHEITRKGDDAWLRVGLIIEGPQEDIPEPLLPRWMKQVRKTLRYTSGSMIYLIPGAMHPPGETWKSPFSSKIDMVSVGGIHTDDGWYRVSHEFTRPVKTVGLWIMADGDNTGSTFNSRLRKLVVE